MNSKGMSLIELMIAVGVSTVIGLSSVILLENMVKSQISTEAGQDLAAMVYETGNILSNPVLCRNAMVNGDSVNGREIELSTNIRRNGNYGKLILTSVRLDNVRSLGTLNRTADIIITGSNRGETYGSKNFVEKAKVFYSVDASNAVVSCLDAEVTPEETCLALGGSWNGTNCNFCRQLGGTILADGTCQLQGATVYGWQPTAWSLCASGLQTRNQDCRDLIAGLVVADSYCTTPRLPVSQICFNYDWRVGAWACNAGTETRSVICADTYYGNVAPNGDADCSSARPESVRACANDCVVAAGTSWSVNGNTCNASSSVTIAKETSGTVSDTVSPTTGSATYSCDAAGNLSLPAGTSCSAPVVTPTTASVSVEAEGTCNGNEGGTSAGSSGSINLATGGTVQDSYNCQYDFSNGGGGNVSGCRVVIVIGGQSYTAPWTASQINAGGYVFNVQYSPGGSSGVIGSQCRVSYSP